MANEFIARKGFIALESSQITGSLFVSGTSFFTGSIDILGGIENTQFIDFDIIATPAYQEGRINWIDDTKTLAIDTELNGFSIEVGHQNVIRARNETGTTILRGKAVYLSGSSGNRPLIYTSSYELDPTSAGTVGLVAADIGHLNTGYVISNGLIRDIDTRNFLAGAVLYLSSSGQLSTTAPVAPLHAVRMGKVITSGVAGIIHVDVDNGYEIGELHDVVDTSTSSTYGDLLVKSGSVWKSGRQLTGSYGLTGSLTATTFVGSLTGTSSWATNALTASSVTTLNQNVLITGSLTIGSSSIGSSENTLIVGPSPAGGTGEGGQILLQAVGGTYATASMIDNYQNKFRVLRGTNAGSDAFKLSIDMHTGQVQVPNYNSTTAFTSTAVVGILGFDSNGNLLTTTASAGGGGGGGSVTINNNTDNYVITATGTANTLNGEAALTFDGITLTNTGKSQFGGASVLNTTHQFKGSGSDSYAGFLLLDPDGEEAFKLAGSMAASDFMVTIGDVNNAYNTTKIEVDDPNSKINLKSKVYGTAYATNATTLGTNGTYDIGSRLATSWAVAGGPTLIAGRIVYLSGSTQWAQAQANTSGSSYGMLGVVTDAASQNEILIQGTIQISGSALTSGIAGQPVYLSALAAGQVTLTAPSSSGHVVRTLGYIYKANSNIMYFSPDNSYIVRT